MMIDGVVHPDFLYIGAARAGSSWIYECLREHPQVFVPVAKDIEYFDNNFTRGREWYLAFFQEGKGRKAVGELSHDYYLLETTARRIHDLLPQARLICSLREPVDKMISHYLYARRLHPRLRFDFTDLIADPDKISRTGNHPLSTEIDLTIESVDYYRKLLPFFSLFPRENILVLFYDDLQRDPHAFIRSIYRFLGVAEDFVPTVLDRRVNPAGNSRFPRLTGLLYSAARLVRKMGGQNLVGRMKRNVWLKRFMFTPPPERIDVPEETRRYIHDFAARDYPRLAEMIGRDLPAGWTDPFGPFGDGS